MRWLDFALVAAVTIALATSIHIVQGDRTSPPARSGASRARGVASLALPTTLSLVGGSGSPSGAEQGAVGIEIVASGRPQGSAADFDAAGAPHSVIGNGQGAGDGEVQLTVRGRSGAIDAARPRLRICLIGDPKRGEPTPAQCRALVDLCRHLGTRYGIPPERIVATAPWEGLSIAWLRDQLRK